MTDQEEMKIAQKIGGIMDAFPPGRNENKQPRGSSMAINFYAPCEVINIDAAQATCLEFHIYRSGIEKVEPIPEPEKSYSQDLS